MVKLPYRIPYYCQFVSPELVLDIIRGRVRAEDDPRWLEFGARTREEYAYWSWKACGAACLKMAVEALGGPERSMMAWIDDALKIGGFLREDEVAPGRPSGWIHKALVDLARAHSLEGECRVPVDLEDIASLLDKEQVVIASVSPELGEMDRITTDRGHLVVVFGYSRLDANIEALLVNNPSGRHMHLRENCWISAVRFQSGFSDRLVTLFAQKP